MDYSLCFGFDVLHLDLVVTHFIHSYNFHGTEAIIWCTYTIEASLKNMGK